MLPSKLHVHGKFRDLLCPSVFSFLSSWKLTYLQYFPFSFTLSPVLKNNYCNFNTFLVPLFHYIVYNNSGREWVEFSIGRQSYLEESGSSKCPFPKTKWNTVVDKQDTSNDQFGGLSHCGTWWEWRGWRWPMAAATLPCSQPHSVPELHILGDNGMTPHAFGSFQ